MHNFRTLKEDFQVLAAKASDGLGGQICGLMWKLHTTCMKVKKQWRTLTEMENYSWQRLCLWFLHVDSNLFAKTGVHGGWHEKDFSLLSGGFERILSRGWRQARQFHGRNWTQSNKSEVLSIVRQLPSAQGPERGKNLLCKMHECNPLPRQIFMHAAKVPFLQWTNFHSLAMKIKNWNLLT